MKSYWLAKCFIQKHSLPVVRTWLQIKCSNITNEKLFRMSSCSHKWHDYDEKFIRKSFIFHYVSQKDILNVVNQVENLQETKLFETIKLFWSWKMCEYSANFFSLHSIFFSFDLDVVKYFWGHSSEVKDVPTYPQIICIIFWSD